MRIQTGTAFFSLAATLLSGALEVLAQSSNVFTFQIGTVAAGPVTLVQRTNLWSLRRGTNEPGANWQTLPDSALDATWATAPGGFGYGDPAITGELTTLSGMVNVHSTLYLRKTFTVGSLADTNLHLRLTVDYDDGFVAYLDGVEVARRNLTNGVGTFVAYNNTTVTSHEASCCDAPTHPAETIDLGAAGARLAAGSHVLALIGVNGTLGSSDFHLGTDLQLDSSTSPPINGTFFSLVTDPVILLSGTNTLAGAARVTVNGDDASFNSLSGAWAKTQSLQPGLNRLFIASLDGSDRILATTNRDVIAQTSSTQVGGTLGGNTTWTSAMGIIHVTNTVVVPSGATLSVGSGMVVLLGPGVSLRATAGGTIDIAGTEASPDFFLPADGTSNWGALEATGAGASLSARHIETAAGAITFNTGANGWVEDASLHDCASILTANGAGLITTRRLHVWNYSETIYNAGTRVLAEDSLYEGLSVPSSDGLEIQGGPAGSVVRRCTFRRSTGGNSDAVDLNGTSGARIESCLIHDFTDKGISLGASGVGGTPDYDILITNCLIYHVETGIAVKDSSTVGLYDTTVAAATYGLNLYQKFSTPVGGGLVTNGFNNILWGLTVPLLLTNGAVVTMNYSDVQGTNWPGTGNLSADPLFVNPAAGDFRLGAGSPALGSGLNGANMGVHWPVGGLPSPPVDLAAHAAGSNPPRLWWQEDADNEAGFSIERSPDAANWQVIGAVEANGTNYTDNSALVDQRYYYRVRATNVSGASRYSNLATARRQGTTLFAGGTLTANTVWSPALGPIYVISNLTVPANVTLTLEAGTVVRLTNNATLTASTGGVLRILGTWDNRVVLECWNGTNNWGEVGATGTNAFLEMHFADVSGGQTTVYYDATALLEDTFFHDFRRQGTTTLFNQPLILTHYAGPCIVRRCHLDNYHETLWRHGVNLIEDTVFEHTSGDALDFDTGRPGSVIRRCTFRHGNLGNVDAIDIGNDGPTGTEGAIIEDCHMYDFPFDKGVSIGENSFNITVRNCLIHHVVRGIQVKDVCTANIYHCTITAAETGIHGYEKVAGTGAGRVTNSYNNILWGLSNAIVYDPALSVMVVNYSDTGGTNWPNGIGNFNRDPLFVNPDAWDWRFQPDSPCLGTGKEGANLGVSFPVGVFIPAPSQLAAAATPGSVQLTWRDNSPSEAVFLVERAADGGPFTNLAHVPLNTTNYTDSSVLSGHSYRYRLRGANLNTNSEYSNEIGTEAGLTVTITAPADGALLSAPTDLTLTALATSVAGRVTQVRFFAGTASLGVATTSPYTLTWSNVPLGVHALTATALDDLGQAATSAVVTVTVHSNTAPPLGFTQTPPPGTVSHLTQLTVTFNQPVFGVDAADLLINGLPASGLSGSGSNYTFFFPQPTNGLVLLSWADGHGIQDAAGHPLTAAPWNYILDPNLAVVLISEIMYHPRSEKTEDEFIELFNSGPTNVNLAGWRLSQGLRFTFPEVVLPAGHYLVVAAKVATFTHLYPGVTNVVGDWDGILSNNRNTIGLEDASGRRVDSVTYASEGDWAVRQRSPNDLGFQGWHWLKEHDGLGKSLELINSSLPNEYGQNWAASLVPNGTPGRANSVASANLPPFILEVQHLPAIPSHTNPVIVSARILDQRASNTTVTLHWRVDAVSPPPFASTNMADDGTHGDGVAGDGWFAATLPPQAPSAIVEFYLRAQDQDGLVRTWPAAVLDTNGLALGQLCNALYQVDTNVVAGDQPLYRLIMTERERAILYQIQHGSFGVYPSAPGTAQSDAAMNGTFLSRDDTGLDCRYAISIRNRGHGTRIAHPNNFRVNFNSDRPWKNVGALILNGQFTHYQVFGTALAQRSGLAGADSRAVQVRVNGTNLALLDNYPDRTYGSYAATEALGSDWAEHHFPADGSGNLYRVVRDLYVPSASFNYRGPDPTAYTNCFFKQSNVSQDDWADLVSLLRVMGTNDLFTTETVRQGINVEQWMLHLAVMTLLGNDETGLNTGFNDDYFLYRGVTDPRFLLVSYDLDTILSRGRATNSSIWDGTTTHLSPPQDSGQAMARFLHWPAFEPIYYRTLQHLLDTTFSAPQFNALLNQVVAGFVPTPTLQAMTNWMNGRRAYVQSAIAPYVTAPSNAPVAVISGEPRAVTPFSGATLTVGGSGIVAYRFSLNGGAYSDETPTNLPITLSALPHGSTNSLRVLGKNSSDLWQSPASPTVSSTWVVLTNWPSVRLNEILARNDSAVNWSGQRPDLIELFNEGPSPADLSGLRLTDDPAAPSKFTFPAGTTLAPGDYLIVIAGNPDGTPGLHTGFALRQEGDGVYLLDRAPNDAVVLDSVQFGLQIADLALGRLGHDARWWLSQPSFGSANVPQPLGNPLTLKINEWMVLGQTPSAAAFLELYNPDPLPVALGGLYLSDQPFGTPARHQIAPLSFVSARGYQALLPDGNPQNGSNHLGFQLAAEQGLIGLMAPDLSALDQVWYGPQRLNQATGRCPDGSANLTALAFPTPGSANACPPEPIPPLTLTLLASTNLWRYEQSGADQGTAWRAPTFDDSAWPQGPGPLGFADTAIPEPINTPLTVALTKTNFYFRTTFLVPANSTPSGLQVTHLVDDGAVFYLNGQEAYRYNMPAGPILATTFAATTLHASSIGPVSLPITNLYAGTNSLAVEAHQATRTSSDIVFGCKLELVVYTNPPATAGLVLNEILANNATLAEADGRTPDWIELHNPSAAGVDLSDLSLSDAPANPRRWVFPPGAVIPPHGYFLVRCDSGLPASATNTGFGLQADGDSVYLFDKLANGGGALDFIFFGLQTPDLSIGRLPGAPSTWNLTLPTPGATNLPVALGDPTRLRINEWMANPSAGDDWFELFNPQSLPVALGGLGLTDDLTAPNKSPLPPLSFLGVFTNAYQRFWADNQRGGAHANFALKATGEQLALFSPDTVLIDAVVFGAQAPGLSEGRLPDGAATRVFFSSPTPGRRNVLPLPSVVINEVLAHTDLPFEDAIELQNVSPAPVNLGGWWLSDASDRPQKYQIPAGTVLPPGGFAVFYEAQFNDPDHADVPFALSSAKGDEVHLSSVDTNGVLDGYRAAVKFGPSLNGVSFGRYVTSTGDADFPPMSARSLGVDNPTDLLAFRSGTGLPNPSPLVGPVVISQIMYHPRDLGTNDNVLEEFIQLHNLTPQTVLLYDPSAPSNTWRLRDAVDFDFPPHTSLPPGASLAVVSFDPTTNLASLALFQAKYGTNATLFGPYTGKLDNSDESVELLRPDAPETEPGPDLGLVPYVVVDRVHYRDLTPWPTNADGWGDSLHRLNLTAYGNDPTNWLAAPPALGTPAPSDSDGDGMSDAWELAHRFDPHNPADAPLDADADGQSNLNEFLSGTDPRDAQSLLRVACVLNPGSEPQILFLATAGHTYSVLHRPLPDRGPWTPLTNLPARPTNWTATVPDPSARTTPQRFYRLVTPAQP